jgi:hypothetical protein
VPLSFSGGSASAATADANSLIDIVATAPGDYVVPVADPFDLREAGAARLTFESLFAGANARALVQVSVDGQTWLTYHEVAPANDWKRTEIDLSALTGESVFVRFVLVVRDPAEAADAAAWRLRNVRIVR